VWKLILNNQLDDIAVAVGERRRERMEKFASDLFLAIDRSAKKIQVSSYSPFALDMKYTHSATPRLWWMKLKVEN